MIEVSVVVPVYNDPGGATSALESLVGQRLDAAYEIVVVDNGSTDETPEVLERFRSRYPDRIRLGIETEVQSSYAARNRGIARARGRVLAFTDADCVPDADWLAEGVRALADSGAALAAGRIEMTFRGERPTVWEYFDATRKLNQRLYAETYGFGATANLFVRAEAIAEHGGFRGDLVSGGDYEFGRRLTGAGARLVYADRAVVRHPARGTPLEILRKSRRIARGQKQLENLGLLEHGRLGWRSLVPTRRCPPLGDTPPTPAQAATFIAFSNVVKYWNLLLRL